MKKELQGVQLLYSLMEVPAHLLRQKQRAKSPCHNRFPGILGSGLVTRLTLAPWFPIFSS